MPAASSDTSSNIFVWLEQVDRRIIYLIVAVSLALPIILNISLKPARMQTATEFYEAVDALETDSGKIALVAFDWGPGTMAENMPQTELAIEHLMRKRIPFAAITSYTLAKPFLQAVPRAVAKRLAEETGETWVYGKDWVNLGYKPGWSLMIQALAKSENWHEYLKEDANATPIAAIPMMKNVTSIKDVAMLLEFTGLVGAFNAWLGYFQTTDHTPTLLHGCTSITIPEAYIFYESNQIVGFFEGVAGAAWYEMMLAEKYTSRPKHNVAIGINSGLSFAQLGIIFFIFLGNVGLLVNRYSGSDR